MEMHCFSFNVEKFRNRAKDSKNKQMNNLMNV